MDYRNTIQLNEKENNILALKSKPILPQNTIKPFAIYKKSDQTLHSINFTKMRARPRVWAIPRTIKSLQIKSIFSKEIDFIAKVQ
jgi:hypothetical protein